MSFPWMAAAAAALAGAPRGEGVHELELTVDGRARAFTVLVPPGSSAGRPVVLALHYAGHGAPHYATGFVQQLVGPALSELGAVIVAPDCPNGTSWADPAAERIALAVLDHTLATWGGDPRQVVLTGYSMGGRGTWSLAAHHPERFAALVPVAGDPGTHVDAVARAGLPVYAIGGTRDTVIPPGPSERAVGALTAAGRAAVWVPLDLGHYDTARYRPALWAAIPWLQEQLARRAQGTSDAGSSSRSGK